MDRDDQRAVHQQHRPELLPTHNQERGSQFRGSGQPRQRQHQRRSAITDRRRVPRTGASRDPARQRPHDPIIADRRRRHDRAPDAQRTRLLPLRHQLDRVGGRLRRLLPAERLELLGARRALATDGRRHRASVACALGRARRVRRCSGPTELGADAADGDAQHDLRPGTRARAGLGRPSPVGVAVRDRPRHGLDRLRARATRGVGQPADMGPGTVRATRA